jgi:hypothetical protein
MCVQDVARYEILSVLRGLAFFSYTLYFYNREANCCPNRTISILLMNNIARTVRYQDLVGYSVVQAAFLSSTPSVRFTSTSTSSPPAQSSNTPQNPYTPPCLPL